MLDPVIHVLRIREYRDRLKFVCRCYNQANNNTEVITLTQAIHICSGISVVTYSVPRESELRRLNKPHNTGIITLTQAIHICSGITVVTYSVPRESELRSLNKPHNTGVITLTQAIHICSGITVVNYLYVLCP